MSTDTVLVVTLCLVVEFQHHVPKLRHALSWPQEKGTFVQPSWPFQLKHGYSAPPPQQAVNSQGMWIRLWEAFVGVPRHNWTLETPVEH
eukprot:12419444-Karenia_brevis.AAC.1